MNLPMANDRVTPDMSLVLTDGSKLPWTSNDFFNLKNSKRQSNRCLNRYLMNSPPEDVINSCWTRQLLTAKHRTNLRMLSFTTYLLSFISMIFRMYTSYASTMDYNTADGSILRTPKLTCPFWHYGQKFLYCRVLHKSCENSAILYWGMAQNYAVEAHMSVGYCLIAENYAVEAHMAGGYCIILFLNTTFLVLRTALQKYSLTLSAVEAWGVY